MARKRKIQLSPGDKPHITIPSDTPEEVLEWLNKQGNLGEAFVLLVKEALNPDYKYHLDAEGVTAVRMAIIDGFSKLEITGLSLKPSVTMKRAKNDAVSLFSIDAPKLGRP